MQRKMNPAMAKLMEQKQESAGEKNPTEPVVANKQQSKALPKADPPKLILARTHFLLTHGESILPAYVSYCIHSLSRGMC
jgi:hypothetical protein